ncbi:olfactory receptor 10A7-like [Ambystoma mexicanum]|uniref:olfactory receptor 10A7-like n=1 Tax=Ambystoma mexicanum TaxID=8296 RepID=UPI0037E8B31F
MATEQFWSVTQSMERPLQFGDSVGESKIRNVKALDTSMIASNGSSVGAFLLLGFSDVPQLQSLLFAMFFLMYLLAVTGNLLLVILITLNNHLLQAPMYLFLRTFCLAEIALISVTVPKMLSILWVGEGWISFLGCATQMYFFLCIGSTECFLLAVMAYDRYVAICLPLHYATIMTLRRCHWLSVGCWLGGLVFPAGQVTFTISLPYCSSHVVDHFFCDISPVLTLACDHPLMNQVLIWVNSILILVIPFHLVLVSYARILSAILGMHSSAGRRKAFSTCSSHLLSVCLFYGTGSATYLRTSLRQSGDSDKSMALLYCVITPMLNPLIYGLRNKEVKKSLVKIAAGRS